MADRDRDPPKDARTREDLEAAVRRDNLEYHRDAAPLYDLNNPGMHNLFEKYLLGRDLALIARLLASVDKPLCLDCGAGTGRIALRLAARGWDVVALDLSEDMLRICRRRAARSPGRLWPVCMGAEEFLAGTKARFDLIAFSALLHHVTDYLAVVEAAADRLKPGGVLYITHEPELRRRRGGLGTKLLRQVDHLLRLPHEFRKHVPRLLRRLPRARARPLTDYHSEQGCDSEAILNGLRARGFRVVHFRHYRPRCTAPIAWLDTVLQLDPEADFRLVAQAGTSLPQDGRCGATASSPP